MWANCKSALQGCKVDNKILESKRKKQAMLASWDKREARAARRSTNKEGGGDLDLNGLDIPALSVPYPGRRVPLNPNNLRT